MLNKTPIIGVMGSHKEEWPDLTSGLGELIALKGYHLLTGAGDGVMSSIAQSFCAHEEREGKCIGIYPVEKSEEIGDTEKFPNPYIEIPIVVPLNKKAMSHSMPFSRNMVNIMSSSVVIALPGWYGTQTEVSMALQIDKPLILYGPEGEFDKFPLEPHRARELEEIEAFIDRHLG